MEYFGCPGLKLCPTETKMHVPYSEKRQLVVCADGMFGCQWTLNRFHRKLASCGSRGHIWEVVRGWTPESQCDLGVPS